jgi:mRNA interferase MazF
MKRGEVWWVSFDPSLQTEIKKTRPAVIISNDFSNQALERVQVIPLTSNVDKLYPSEAYVLLRGKKAKVMSDQIATVSKGRLKQFIATLSYADMSVLEDALRLQLKL